MSVQIVKHLEKLGYKCEDKITGFTGVIITIGFDLYGCIQATVQPGVSKEDGKVKYQDGGWYDINRLEITSKKPVMDAPEFSFREHLKMLGHKCVDCVAGFNGVATSIGFDLYGSVQVYIQPEVLEGKYGKIENQEGFWFDINRYNFISKKPLMEVPDFDFGFIAEGRKGPAEKPLMRR